MKTLLLLISMLLGGLSSQGQILISLLFGDKLNSEKLEFGLDGGVNFAQLSGIDGDFRTGFHLGFYFDIKTNSKWIMHTGLMLSSPMGAQALPPYSIGREDIDNILADGKLERKLQYFSVPFLMKHPIYKSLNFEAGIMASLMSGANDVFTLKVTGSQDLTLNSNIRKALNPLDIGPMIGLNYRLLGGNGMNLGVRYYHGLINVNDDLNEPDFYNQSLYLAVGIPIGAAKAKESSSAAQE